MLTTFLSNLAKLPQDHPTILKEFNVVDNTNSIHTLEPLLREEVVTCVRKGLQDAVHCVDAYDWCVSC